MATDPQPDGAVMCLVDRGTEVDEAGLKLGERLADAIGAPLTAHPVPRRGAVEWPAGADRAAVVIAPAEERALPSLFGRGPRPALARELGVPLVLLTEAAARSGAAMETGEVVCGVERSHAARSAARAASVLAQRLDLPLALVHAQEPIPAVALAPVGGTPVPVPDEVLEEQRDAGWDLLAAIDTITPQPARLRLRRARPSSCLDDYAVQHDAPLLVLGAPARGPLSSLLLGSTAWQLSRHARTPVMYVPEEPTATWWR